MRSFLTRHWLSLLLLAVVLTRLPYIFAGYGSDPDAWLVASSASTLWNTGEYSPSRLPGYPLHELVLAPVVSLGGAPLSNLCTLLFTLIAVVIWSRIAQQHSPHPKLLTLALAFSPVVWQHSGDTLDYLWSLCFILAAVRLAEQRKIVLSAIACSMAIGFRLANAVFVVPLVVFLLLKKHALKEILLFCSVCILTSVAEYLPLLTKYGLAGWIESTRIQMSDIHPASLLQRAIAFGYRTVYSMGPLTIALAAALLVNGRQHLWGSLRVKEPMTVFSLIAIIVYLVLFWMIPLERAYLLPAMPFLFLLVSRVSTAKQFALWTAVLISSGLVTIDVIDREDRRRVHFNIHEGIVIQEYLNRREGLRVRKATALMSFNHKSVVMTSDITFWFENDLVELAPDPGFIDNNYEGRLQFEGHRKLVRQVSEPDVLFITYLLRHELEAAQSLSYTVYCLKHAREQIENEVGYQLEEVGVTIIDVD